MISSISFAQPENNPENAPEVTAEPVVEAPPQSTRVNPFLPNNANPNEECTVYVEPGTTNFDISTVENPTEGVTFADDLVIGDITYTRYPIFDETNPKENNWLFQFADYLHIDTKERVIRDQLLIHPGDKLNMRIVEESGRELRDSDYLYDARVWPYRVCGNRADIEVLTREVWTLSGGFSFSRKGGAKDDSIWLADSNFLGRGETLSIARTSNTDRSGIEFGYSDPNVAGGRHTLDLFYADNDDGNQTKVEIQRPFYSLDTKHSWGLSYNDNLRVEDLYERGDEYASFQSHYENNEVFFGASKGWVKEKAKRWWFGLHTQKETFLPDPDPNPEFFPPVPFPEDREINYPFISYSKLDENFIKVSNLNNIHRTEDFGLGLTWGARFGIADEAFGSDRDRLVYTMEVRKAWRLSEHVITQAQIGTEGMWHYDDDTSEDVNVQADWRYYDGVGKSHGTYLAVDLRYVRNLPYNKQLLLGAEENLRGYPARYQAGTRSFIITAEHRYYTNWHWFQLVRVGGAVFADVGRAWDHGDPNEDATGILTDVGFGLRLASSRAQTQQVLHVDFAFPLNSLEDTDSMEITITAKQSF